MKRLILACVFVASASLLCGPTEARKKRVVEDPILELGEEDYGARVTRSRTVYDYSAAQNLLNAPLDSTRILVTTREMMPDGKLYPIAEAVYESLKEKFPLTEFQVVGRDNLDGFIEMARENFDYLVTVGTNYSSRDYDYDQTVYSSRSTGVRCRSNWLGGGVDCTESSSTRTPTGSRTVQRSIFSDILFVTYGPAATATVAYSMNDEGQISKRSVSNSREIGNTSITLGYGTTDASWCEKAANAQVFLSRMTAKNVFTGRPDEFTITVAPDEIGCEG